MVRERQSGRVPAGYASPEVERRPYPKSSVGEREERFSRPRESARLSSFYRKRFGSQSPESYLNLRISHFDRVLGKEDIRDRLEEELKDMAPFVIKIVSDKDDEQRLAYVNFEHPRAAKNVRRHLIDRLQKRLGPQLMIDPAGIVRDQDGKYVPDRYNRDHDRRHPPTNEHLSPIRSRDALRLGGGGPALYNAHHSGHGPPVAYRRPNPYPVPMLLGSGPHHYHKGQRRPSISPEREYKFEKSSKKTEQEAARKRNSHSMTHSEEGSPAKKLSQSPDSISESSDNGSVSSSSSSSPDNSLRSVSRSPSPVNQIRTREQLAEEVPSTWKGLTYFKRAPYTISMHRIWGKEHLLQDILRDDIGNSLPLTVNKHFQMDTKFYDRIVAFKEHELAVMLAVQGNKNTTFKPLIDYLQLRKAAGVINLEEGGTLYVLTYSPFSAKMLKYFAPQMTPVFGPDSDNLLMLLKKADVSPKVVEEEPSNKSTQLNSKVAAAALREKETGEIGEDAAVHQSEKTGKENIDTCSKKDKSTEIDHLTHTPTV
uniref:SPOC domain-containing protein n=1 Tax=Ditylenchus dipsaci TaxID=166011 RepID=A0A915CS36_9BILA